MKNGSQEDWWSSGLIFFDDIAVLVTDDINTDLDDFVIEEAGLTVWPNMVELSNGKGQAVRETIRRRFADRLQLVVVRQR